MSNSGTEQSRAEQSRAELKSVTNIPELISNYDNIIKKIYRTILPFSLRKAVRTAEKKFYDITLPLKIKLNLPLKKKRKHIGFEIQLVEHCNLNCKGCSHFSPISEPEFLDVDEFERDIKRLSALSNHECDRIHLMGGEPLLHPEINKILKIARDNFSRGVIDIVTNGILLTQMDEDFWRTCRDYKIYIEISHYPINIQEDKIKELAEKFGVTCFWDIIDSKDKFFVYAIDLEGKQDYIDSFVRCTQANTCMNLSHGRLYLCPFAAHVHHFNKKFNQNVVVTDKDYIDIYSNITERYILSRFIRPVQVCRFCKLKDLRKTHWGISKQDINEWL